MYLELFKICYCLFSVTTLMVTKIELLMLINDEADSNKAYIG